jgi:outer membrane protein OmpA-like peptidoglycan-associated protein
MRQKHTDEFDGAQMSSSITSLVQGRGQYNIRLTLPPQYEHFSMASSGATQVEDCTPGGPSVSCKINNTGKPGCFHLEFRLPPIPSSHKANERIQDRIEALYFFAGTGAFLSRDGKSKIVFTMPGDYSIDRPVPGGHKLDSLATDLAVETNFVFDQQQDLTTLVVANGNSGGSVDNRVGLTIYGRATRGVSARELKESLDMRGRAVLHINFDFDKATLRPDAVPAIEQVAVLLKDNPVLRLELDGHTDGIGTKEHNRILSDARARTVRNALLIRGITADRLTTAGFGANVPVANNATEDGRFKNRRVELVRR